MKLVLFRVKKEGRRLKVVGQSECCFRVAIRVEVCPGMWGQSIAGFGLEGGGGAVFLAQSSQLCFCDKSDLTVMDT